MNSLNSIDIFCAVVDNFGDIGVCWRLARQAAVERGLKTRLFVDDMTSFRTIIPAPDTSVEIIPWDKDFNAHYTAADIVIEGFACNLPPSVLSAITLQKPVWIDLEYLTAENWALGCHGIPSFIPSQNTHKTLFFPSFDKRTGGLIRENDLINRRNAFQMDKNAQNEWRKAHSMPEIDTNTIDISLFCYKTAPIENLIRGVAGLTRKVRIMQPTVNPSLSPTLSQKEREDREIEVIPIPFLSQYDYDYLLWTCDFNFVRGEDSFVRAQFAGKPFIWNIYRQDEDGHLVKLRAFLDTIKHFYDTESFERLAILHEMWNEGARNTTQDGAGLWQTSFQSLAGFQSGARKWADYLIDQNDLLTRLLTFAETQNKKR